MKDEPAGGRSRFRRLMDVVGAALDVPPGARDAFLTDEFADDPDLLAEARALLAESEATSFRDATARIERVVGSAAVDAVGDAHGGGRHPERIGSYEIVRPLGRGGMGLVYLARQEGPLRRDVALKIVRGRFADRDTLARFAAERQALALMHHPNIAQVFDAGATEDGLPYFVMELVEGQPITEFCEGGALRLGERLELFRSVCLAVHHAHQRGVIHRDLKPANVLVTEVAGRPEPKIIDFGIAKATDGILSDDSVHTRAGSFIGTIDYMSPERLGGDGRDIDVRADVYSLGVILYELLTGRHPFDDTELRRGGLVEAHRVILEREPPRPSTHTGRSARRESDRGTASRPPRPRFREELDWVVMKALEKDRERRYQSARELSDDIERYGRDEPVSAGPPGVAYRTRKFVSRHRVGVTATALILLALVGGATATTVGFVRARAEGRRAEAIGGFLTDMLASVRPDQAGRAVTVREVLDEARARLEAGEFADDPETDASLALVIGHSYEGLGSFDDARSLIERSLALRRSAHDDDDPRVYASLHRLGTVLWKQGALDEALAVRLELADITERTVGTSHRDHAESLSNLGNTYADMGDFARSAEYLREAVAVGRRLEGDAGRLDLARFLNNLGSVFHDLRDFESAVVAYDEVLQIRGAILGDSSDVYAITLVNLGNAQSNLGDLENAEETLRRAVSLEERIFGEDHPTTAFAYSGLASVLARRGEADEAEAYVRRALAIRAATVGDTYWRVAQERRKLAEILMDTGRSGDAIRELEEAWAGLVAAGSETHSVARDVATVMARLQAQLGNEDEVRKWELRASGP